MSFDPIPDFFREYCRSNIGKPNGEVSHRFTSKVHSGEIIEFCHICEFANVATYAILKNYITHYLIRKLLYVPPRANDFHVNQLSIGGARSRIMSFWAKNVSFSYFICAHLLQTQHTLHHFVDLIEIYNICKKVLELDEN